VPHAIPSIFLDCVGSTNTAALEMAAAGEQGPLWVVAGLQTEGRGRGGRRWVSAPGNLYASLLLRPACPLAVVHQLSLVSGVALVEAIGATLAERDRSIAGLRLKWPNDVLIGTAKCAGILPESRSAGSREGQRVGERQRAGQWEGVVAVIGIGVNLAAHPANLGQEATHLAAHGLALTPMEMLQPLSEAMARWLKTWDGGAGFARVRTAWLGLAGAQGESLRVTVAGEQIDGNFVDLDPGGALLLRDASGTLRTVAFGDVSLVSSPTAPASSAPTDDADAAEGRR
jgi:BirA family biotin operon repressor/biotin-[acetyl-CoA-carboxylase] ligase